MADEVIGRADYVLGVDNAGVKKGVAESEQLITASGAKTEAAAESSAYRTGVAIGNGIKAGVKVVAAGATALFAIATKGALELQQVQADYTAETGATADEANRAAKAINNMAGRNIQPLAEIGRTAAKVRTDLGLVGDEADKTTEGFLRFARATKQDAAGAVVAFDDILDSWGLTAKDAQGIMDKLIVSHQRYGGSIQDNQRALATLAPQLRALNLSLDDGIGLLNLFAASGLDAVAMQSALNTAITKLPKGESLTQFLTRLSQVVDDGQRAQMAMDVFGQKAGAKLANAIRPGIAGLDSFKVSTQEATGATEKAADALDSTFGARAQLMFNKFSSALRGLGSDWGPLLTGAASAGTLLTSIFGETAVRSLGPKFIAAMKSIGQQGGDALADGITNVWQGAGGTVAGNFIASRIEAMVDSTKNSRIAAAIRTGAAKAGALWGFVFAGAQGIASNLYSGVASAISGTAAAGAVRAAVLATAIELGTLQGTAMGTAFAAALGVAAIAAAAAIPIIILRIGFAIADELQPFRKSFQAAWNARADAVANGTAVWVDAGKKAGEQVGQATGDAAGQRAGDAMVTAWKSSLGPIGPQVGHAVTLATKGAFGSDLAARSGYARAYANRLGGAVAAGILDKRGEVDKAWSDLMDMIKNGESATARTAHLLGELASKELVKGLHAGDPATRAQARFTKQAILDELAQLKPRAGTLSKEAMENLRRAMKSKDPDIRAAAQAIYRTIHTHLPDKTDGTSWGKAVGAGVAAGLNAMAYAVGQAAGRLAGIIAAYLKTASPSKLGPLSTLGGPEGWGRRAMAGYAAGIAAGAPAVNRALNRGVSLSAIGAPFLNRVAGAPGLADRAAPASSTSVRHGDVSIGSIHLHGVGSDVTPAASQRFGRMVMEEVAKGLREQGARRGIHPSVNP